MFPPLAPRALMPFPGVDQAVFAPPLPDGLLESLRASMQTLLEPAHFGDVSTAMQALSRIAAAATSGAQLIQTWHPAGAFLPNLRDGIQIGMPPLYGGGGDENFGLAMFREVMGQLKEAGKKPPHQKVGDLTEAIKNAKDAGLHLEVGRLQKLLDKAIASLEAEGGDGPKSGEFPIEAIASAVRGSRVGVERTDPLSFSQLPPPESFE